MSLTQFLPAVESELVDGGLMVEDNTVISDVVLLIWFSAMNNTADANYINVPIKINKPDAADSIYGLAQNGSSLTRGVYEARNGQANQIVAVSLGPWGSATYVNPTTGASSNIFTLKPGGDATKPEDYIITVATYYDALENLYDLLENSTAADIIVPVDADAFDEITVGARKTNFAYQLAFHLADMSTEDNECLGVIKVHPCGSGTLSVVRNYIGTEPTKDVLGRINGNGTGLLGEEWAMGGSGTTFAAVAPGYFRSNFVSTSAYYGLPPVASNEISLDRRANPIDIGKYISVVAAEPIFPAGAFASGYSGTGECIYAGLVSRLPVKSAPTGKIVPSVTGLLYDLSKSQLESMTEARYVTFRRNRRGIVVTDGCTASRATSDYNRLSTMRIVMALSKVLRNVGELYIGEGNTPEMLNSLKSAIKAKFEAFVKDGAIINYVFDVVQSSIDAAAGIVSIPIEIVPALEVRRIKLVVNLRSAL
jgi:predicted enzyme related to lactoylglutathione lyase